MHHAVVDGDLPLVESLLSEGSDPDAQDARGFTALHFAAQESRPDIVAVLLSAGASVGLVDQHGNTPLFTAVHNYRDDDSRECVTPLLLAGADRHRTNASGVSPESLALMIANYNVRTFFVSAS